MDNGLEFYDELKALSKKYRGCNLPGFTTVWHLSLACYRADADRMLTLDNTALALEREHLHNITGIPEPVELIGKERK